MNLDVQFCEIRERCGNDERDERSRYSPVHAPDVVWDERAGNKRDSRLRHVSEIPPGFRRGFWPMWADYRQFAEWIDVGVMWEGHRQTMMVLFRVNPR